MKLVPYDAKEVGYYKKTKNFDLLTEFANSEYDCCMVKDYTQKMLLVARHHFVSRLGFLSWTTLSYS